MATLGRPAISHMALAALAGMALLFIPAACGGGEKQVTGLVLEAVERSPTEIELLRVRDEDGRIWEFSTEGNVGFSAVHLWVHQVAGEGIVVTYREVDGHLIASDVTDVSPPGG